MKLAQLIEGLADSKTLTEKRREILAEQIRLSETRYSDWSQKPGSFKEKVINYGLL